MNKIEAAIDKSDYEIYNDFLNIKVDGHFLDEFLDDRRAGYELKGMVPTLLFWMEHSNEREIVWQRILPNPNESTVCPILMCPDDCDFSAQLLLLELQGQTI
ncbi:hypothetical protein [uncultured Imperialibacter sp.]|uniref:hypothetical protein n=1 Tax=uncultured Imperialibacter sp. TaxID=1672639 RepID=UPI0030DA4E15